jgi:hypothetical protein
LLIIAASTVRGANYKLSDLTRGRRNHERTREMVKNNVKYRIDRLGDRLYKKRDIAATAGKYDGRI